MLYCVSDIHGHYTILMKLLERIKFSDSDKLLILGDLCDRGYENLAVLDFVMNNSKNVECLMGNHDEFLRDWLNPLSTYNTDLWAYNGGDGTLSELLGVPESKREDIKRFINSLKYYKIIGTNVFVHAGTLGPHSRAQSIEGYMRAQNKHDLVWARRKKAPESFNNCKFPVTFYCGHTPTIYMVYDYKIVRKGNTVFIDCGLGHGGCLGCVCIDTGRKIYQW